VKKEEKGDISSIDTLKTERLSEQRYDETTELCTFVTTYLSKSIKRCDCKLTGFSDPDLECVVTDCSHDPLLTRVP
jgi:hypothetical protein